MRLLAGPYILDGKELPAAMVDYEMLSQGYMGDGFTGFTSMSWNYSKTLSQLPYVEIWITSTISDFGLGGALKSIRA